MRLDPPTNNTKPFKDAQIFIDGKRKFRVFVQVKDDVDIAFGVEGVEILVGVCLFKPTGGVLTSMVALFHYI